MNMYVMLMRGKLYFSGFEEPTNSIQSAFNFSLYFK